MREIPLSQGKFALVDDSDYEWLTQWKWSYDSGYAARKEIFITASGEKKRKRIWMHRLITNAPDGMEVDHGDHQKTNNQRLNLRVCTRSQNQANSVRSSNTSGFKGVSWHKVISKWQARIKLNGKRLHLGYFSDKIEAARIYNAAAFEYFGEFALLTKIPA